LPILPYAVTSKALPVVLSEPITLKFGMLLLVDTNNDKMSVFCDFIFLTQIVISLIGGRQKDIAKIAKSYD